MVQQEVVVKNRLGLHTRPAASLVKLAAKFKSDFYLERDGYRVNGKSIIGVMTLAAEEGASILLLFEGEDEEAALAALVDFFNRGFDEL
ncbi:MAG TPA: HPr family phosphocarrier protein [Candidatus Kryptobacter bacterium]|nr:MAG: phosphocarrier protein HPr [Ignavibacteriae bacterium 37-53-5]HQT90767.1 HPr family phosphocarrier protein [Candidatus Kryptobacter bacterium]